MDTALGPEDNALAIRRPAKIGINAENRPGFLLIAVELIEERSRGAFVQVVQVQHAFIANAAHKREVIAIRRGHGARRASRARDQRADFARFPVKLFDRVDARVGVFVVLEGRAPRDVF